MQHNSKIPSIQYFDESIHLSSEQNHLKKRHYFNGYQSSLSITNTLSKVTATYSTSNTCGKPVNTSFKSHANIVPTSSLTFTVAANIRLSPLEEGSLLIRRGEVFRNSFSSSSLSAQRPSWNETSICKTKINKYLLALVVYSVQIINCIVTTL